MCALAKHFPRQLAQSVQWAHWHGSLLCLCCCFAWDYGQSAGRIQTRPCHPIDTHYTCPRQAFRQRKLGPDSCCCRRRMASACLLCAQLMSAAAATARDANGVAGYIHITMPCIRKNQVDDGNLLSRKSSSWQSPDCLLDEIKSLASRQREMRAVVRQQASVGKQHWGSLSPDPVKS